MTIKCQKGNASYLPEINRLWCKKNNYEPPQVGSSLVAISKHLNEACSSGQTIVCNTMEIMQQSNFSERKCILSPRDEWTLVQKLQINPRTTIKDLVKMPKKKDTKIFTATVK